MTSKRDTKIVKSLTNSQINNLQTKKWLKKLVSYYCSFRASHFYQ